MKLPSPRSRTLIAVELDDYGELRTTVFMSRKRSWCRLLSLHLFIRDREDRGWFGQVEIDVLRQLAAGVATRAIVESAAREAEVEIRAMCLDIRNEAWISIDDDDRASVRSWREIGVPEARRIILDDCREWVDRPSVYAWAVDAALGIERE